MMPDDFIPKTMMAIVHTSMRMNLSILSQQRSEGASALWGTNNVKSETCEVL